MVATTTPAAKAERLAANLLAADYRGHFSHSLNRLAHYVKGRRTSAYKLGFMAVLGAHCSLHKSIIKNERREL